MKTSLTSFSLAPKCNILWFIFRNQIQSQTAYLRECDLAARSVFNNPRSFFKLLASNDNGLLDIHYMSRNVLLELNQTEHISIFQ